MRLRARIWFGICPWNLWFHLTDCSLELRSLNFDELMFVGGAAISSVIVSFLKEFESWKVSSSESDEFRTGINHRLETCKGFVWWEVVGVESAIFIWFVGRRGEYCGWVWAHVVLNLRFVQNNFFWNVCFQGVNFIFKMVFFLTDYVWKRGKKNMLSLLLLNVFLKNNLFHT